MANSQDSRSPQHPDLLAAVVLHTLVSDGSGGITSAQVAIACERDPDVPGDMREIETALQTLLEDGLALRGGEREPTQFKPTRAAVRASDLSF